MRPTLNERIIHTLEAANNGEAGLTDEELAAKLGVTVAQILRAARKHAQYCNRPGHPRHSHLHDEDAPTLAKTGQ